MRELTQLYRIAAEQLIRKQGAVIAQGSFTNIHKTMLPNVVSRTPRRPSAPVSSSPGKTPAVSKLKDKTGIAAAIAKTPQGTSSVFYKYDGDLTDLSSTTATEAQQIIGQAATTLSRIHAESIVHRDIKDQNFLQKRTEKGFLLVDMGDYDDSLMVSDDGKINPSDPVVFSPFALPPQLLAIFNSNDEGAPKSESGSVAVYDTDTMIRYVPGSNCATVEVGDQEETANAEMQNRINRVTPHLRKANHFQLDTYAFRVMLGGLREKTKKENPTSLRKLDRLIAILEQRAYQKDGSEVEAFTMQDVLEDPYFGDYPRARARFFHLLAKNAGTARTETKQDILPAAVSSIVESIEALGSNADDTAIKQSINGLTGDNEAFKETLQLMLTNAKGIQPEVLNFEDGKANGSLDLDKEAQGQHSETVYEEETLLFSTLRLNVEDEVERLRTDAEKKGYCNRLFSPKAEVTNKKIEIINLVMEELDKKYAENRGATLTTLLTHKVEININSSQVTLSLGEALCLQRSSFSGRAEWTEKGNYGYQQDAKSYTQIIKRVMAQKHLGLFVPASQGLLAAPAKMSAAKPSK